MTNKPLLETVSEENKLLLIELYNNNATQEEIGIKIGLPRRSVMKLCKHFNLKRSTSEASSIKMKSNLDDPKIIEQIKSLRPTHSLQQIVKIIGDTSLSSVDRICKKYNIEKPDNFSELQSEKMKKVWTPEKRKEAINTYKKISGVSETELEKLVSIKDIVFNDYFDNNRSISFISKKHDVCVQAVCRLFNIYNKKQRPLSETYKNLRFDNAKHRKVITQWGVFDLQSDQEFNFLKSLDQSFDVEYESTKFSYGKREYTPDFKVNGEFVEIKPPDRSILPVPERIDFVKQRKIINLNDVEIKTWYDGKYFEASPDEDIDIYYSDWRLFFDDHKQCSEWLLKYGFKPLKLSKRKLWGALNKKVPEEHVFNANYQHQSMVDLIKHFNDHFWCSHRDKYLPIVKIFEPGNTIILRDSIEQLWNKHECNIYSLMRFVNKNYKDFMVPSVFKPWVASGIYDKFLPNGGTIYDPCIGWGGRLIGTIDRDIQYIGSDLNQNSVNNTSNINHFLRNRLHANNRFFQIDASIVKKFHLPEKIDMIFTSPPYDDTETYFGLDKQCQDTNPIYRNLFSLNVELVILNVPQRHSDRLISIATECDYRLSETLEMKTAAPISRDKMFEPIHCFVKN